jgi:hypothetical protein
VHSCVPPTTTKTLQQNKNRNGNRGNLHLSAPSNLPLEVQKGQRAKFRSVRTQKKNDKPRNQHLASHTDKQHCSEIILEERCMLENKKEVK